MFGPKHENARKWGGRAVYNKRARNLKLQIYAHVNAWLCYYCFGTHYHKTVMITSMIGGDSHTIPHFQCDEFCHMYWTAPWWWAEVRNSESPERAASVFAFLSVCLSVCLLPSYRPQFSTQQPNFLKICSLGLWEKRFFSVFRNFDFWPFEGPFSAIFEYFLLYPL